MAADALVRRRHAEASRVKRSGRAAGFLTGLGLAISAHAAPPLIALDIGHSLALPGAISARGQPEFGFNLELANTIHETLRNGNVQTLLIGAHGDLTELKKRTQEARSLGATFFLSVHHDSAQEHYLQPWEWNGTLRRHTTRFSGYSLFVSRRNPFLAESLRCASALGAALRQRGFVPTAHHAEQIPGESREWADEANGVYYFDNLAVLRTAASPAVLFEAGVILNPDEELRLQTPEVRQRMAQAIHHGLGACGALDKSPPGNPQRVNSR